MREENAAVFRFSRNLLTYFSCRLHNYLLYVFFFCFAIVMLRVFNLCFDIQTFVEVTLCAVPFNHSVVKAKPGVSVAFVTVFLSRARILKVK